MTTTKRIRNVAFLGLLMTMVWAGPVTLRADTDTTTNSSGGWFCGYGDCEIHWTDCPGTWNYWSYPNGGTYAPGDCLIQYIPSAGGCTVSSNVDLDVDGDLYKWEDPYQQGSNWWFSCHQIWVEP